MNKKLSVSMSDVMFDLGGIAKRILDLGKKPNHIVALAKGGLIPARILAQRLDIKRIYSYGINFYDDHDIKMKTPVVYQNVDMSSIPRTDSILIVDDIVDSGLSLKWLYTSLEWQGFSDYISCSIFYKSGAIIKPDIYSKEIEKKIWVQFPWE